MIPPTPNIGSSILLGGCPIVRQHGLDGKNVIPRGTIKNHLGRTGIKTKTVDLQKTAIIYFVKILKNV